MRLVPLDNVLNKGGDKAYIVFARQLLQRVIKNLRYF